MNWFIGCYMAFLISTIFTVGEEKPSVTGTVLGTVVGYLIIKYLG